MKLESIINISSAVNYIVRVFDGDNFIEDFVMEYVEMTNEELCEVITNKYLKYKNHTVRHIDTEIKDGRPYLYISINL